MSRSHVDYERRGLSPDEAEEQSRMARGMRIDRAKRKVAALKRAEYPSLVAAALAEAQAELAALRGEADHG